MPPSRLDMIYRRMLITKFFEKGWGKPENLQKLFEFRKIVSNRATCYKLVPRNYPIEVTKEEKSSEFHIIEGKFLTPLELYLPGLVPEESKYAHFQMILPNKWQDERYKPVCVHFAGTGDHFYWRRRNFIAKPLIRESGIGAILLENPFYGIRKPKDQVRSNLRNVSDIFVMGGCLALETLALLHWCEKFGLGPLGVTGLSMGGHNASLAATNWPKPLVLVPCLSWSTASPVFTQGVMSQSINWDTLETQYFADGHYREKLAKMVTIVDDAFLAGKHFIKHFDKSMNELRQDISTVKTYQQENSSDSQHQEQQHPQQQQQQPKNLNQQNSNTFNLSDKLREKVDCNVRINLTKDETNELNQKMLIAQGKQQQLQQQQQQKQQQESDNSITTVKSGMTENVGNTLRATSNAITSTINWSTTKLMSFILPGNENPVENSNQHVPIDTTKIKWYEREALQFMRGVMDECTHLKNFSIPYDTSLITAVSAIDDAYVIREGCARLEEIWPGAEVKYLDAGHVSAYVLHQKLFRSCIAENFEKAKLKYDPNMMAGLPTPTVTFDELYERYKERTNTNDSNSSNNKQVHTT